MNKRNTRISIIRGIYSYDFNKDTEHIIDVMDDLSLDEDSITLCRDTIKGIISHLDSLDATISKYLKKWTIQRLPYVDRAILRVATYEILHCDDIPVGATINEAVEIAKAYSTDKSFGFINGVLSSVVKGMDENTDVEELPNDDSSTDDQALSPVAVSDSADSTDTDINTDSIETI